MLKNILAHTLIEIIISILIFSLLMTGIYTAIDIGFKTWQLGEVKTDFYSRAKVILSYITKDFRYSNWISAKIDNDGDPNSLNEYIVFESPFKNDGSIDIEPKNGKPVWQKYMYYYIYPSVAGDPAARNRTVYCRTAARTSKNSTAMPLDSISPDYLTDAKLSDTHVRVIGKEVYSIDFEQLGTGLIIKIKFRTNVSEHRSVMFDNKNVTEVIELKASVIPEN
ncbi:MAG: prepilin-type N-terminal cleavage/methylation domain-containing protein [Candidatus Eremiobacterota bacterium]